jgi:hypothetical protein
MDLSTNYIAQMTSWLVDETDETFITELLNQLDMKRLENQQLPFQPAIIDRLTVIQRERKDLFYGLFLPGIRARKRIWVPDLLAACQVPTRLFTPLDFVSEEAMLARQIQPAAWIVPGLIAEGLTILGGMPKSGKSYLAYSLALAMSHYGRWLNQWDVPQGPVAVISLEDDADDTRLILAELDPDLTPGGPYPMHFFTSDDTLPGFDEGLVDYLTAMVRELHPRLVILDPLSYLYTGNDKKGDAFSTMRQQLLPLRWLGKTEHCAIVGLDHRRKRSRDDVNIFDTLHGSIAKQAVADALLMVERDQEQLTISALVRRGADAIHTLEMLFRDGRCWLSYSGETTKNGQYGDLRQQVYTCLATSPTPLTIKELLLTLDLPDSRDVYRRIQQTLVRGQKAREVERTTRGAYVLSLKDRA